jgi:hypothetical protein
LDRRLWQLTCPALPTTSALPSITVIYYKPDLRISFLQFAGNLFPSGKFFEVTEDLPENSEEVSHTLTRLKSGDVVRAMEEGTADTIGVQWGHLLGRIPKKFLRPLEETSSKEHSVLKVITVLAFALESSERIRHFRSQYWKFVPIDSSGINRDISTWV